MIFFRTQYIVGFRKEMVNASLLNGKGEIKDLSLNCAAINQQLSNIMPFLELDSIHISKVSFQVTSWTNLRKAPIMVDIEHISIHLSEPLHYLHPQKRRRIKQMTLSQMELYFRQLQETCRSNKTPYSNPNQRGSYNLLDRILDNLHIEIKSIFVQFQTWGKFKTRRTGPWTPPVLMIKLNNLRYVSVDDYGQEGTPDQVGAHNHHRTTTSTQQERTLMIFKKVSMEYDIGIKTADGTLHFSLLKGGQGLHPEVVMSPSTPSSPQQHDDTDNDNNKDKQRTTTTNNKDKPGGSPTAAETVAALANATGPISMVPVPSKAAIELVAALAVGEPMEPRILFTTTNNNNDTITTTTTTTTTKGDDPGGTTTTGLTEQHSRDLPTTTNPNNNNNKASDDETIPSSSSSSKKLDDMTPIDSNNNNKSGGNHALDNGSKKANNGKDCKGDDKTKSQLPPKPDILKPVVPTKNNNKEANNDAYCNNNKVVVQIAMKRRIRDGALLAIQADTILSTVEILIPSEVIPLLIHLALGMQFCFAKDRGFEDPLRSANDRTDHNDASARENYADTNSRVNNGSSSNSRDMMNVVRENRSDEDDAAEKQQEENEVGKVRTGEESEEKVSNSGEASVAPTIDTNSFDAQAKEPKESEAVNVEITADEYCAVSMSAMDGKEREITSGDTSSIEEIEMKLAVRSILESGEAGNSSVTGDLLSALEETVVEDPADNDTLDGSSVSQLQAAEESTGFAKSFSSLFSRRSVMSQASSEATKAFAVMEAALASATGSKPLNPTGAEQDEAVTGGGQPDRAVIMLPNGLVIHEKLSFSVSVDHATIRGVYPSREVKVPVEENGTTSPGAAVEPHAVEQNLDGNDFIQVESRGAVMELIWPKSNLVSADKVVNSDHYNLYGVGYLTSDVRLFYRSGKGRLCPGLRFVHVSARKTRETYTDTNIRGFQRRPSGKTR
jgi:N-terminal region of Chorein or VPS13